MKSEMKNDATRKPAGMISGVPTPGPVVILNLALILTVTLILPSALPTPVFGASHLIRPDGSGDYPTIRAAMLASAPGDTVLLADGTFIGADNRNLDFAGKPLVIRSQSGNAESCIIDCQQSGRGFFLQSGEGSGAVLEGFTLDRASGGYAVNGGGVYCSNGSAPRILGCRFTNCSSYNGGAIGCMNNARPQIIGCTFLSNHGNNGGAIWCRYGCRPVVTDCTFSVNYSPMGASIYCEDDCPVVVTNCSFADPQQTGWGAGIYCKNGSSPTVTGCTFTGNNAYAGGAIYCWINSAPTISHSTFYDNGAMFGGSVYLDAPSNQMVMSHCILAFGREGTAVYCTTTPTVTCCDIFGNDGGDWVGGLAGLEGVNGNISSDPLFCDASHDVFTLSANSPCAAENNPGCGQIGDWPLGCGLGCTLAFSPARIVTYYPGGAPLPYCLNVADAYDLGAFSLCAGFNSSRLQVEDVIIDSGFLGSTGRTVQPLDPVPCFPSCGSGGIRFGATTAGAQPGAFGEGKLASLSLLRIGDGAGQDTLCAEDFVFTTTSSPPETLRILSSPLSAFVHRSFCYGDFNDDGDVTIMDIMQVANRWGCDTGDDCYSEVQDVNLIAPGYYAASLPDGLIDVLDVQSVAGRWRLGCPGEGKAGAVALGAEGGNGLRTETAARLSLFPSELRLVGQAGDTASFAVLIENAEDLGAFELALSFDPAVVGIENVEVEPLLSSTGRSVYPLAWRVDEAKGELTFGAWTLGEAPGPAGSGSLARVTVSLRSCPGRTDLTISRAALAGSLGWPQEIGGTTGGGIVTECSAAAVGSNEELPLTLALHAPWPNPFDRSTSIRFDVPATTGSMSRVDLRIADVAGRIVRRLASGPVRPGRHAFAWDGRSDSGEELPSGIYFCRLAVEGKELTRQTVLIR